MHPFVINESRSIFSSLVSKSISVRSSQLLELNLIFHSVPNGVNSGGELIDFLDQFMAIYGHSLGGLIQQAVYFEVLEALFFCIVVTGISASAYAQKLSNQFRLNKNKPLPERVSAGWRQCLHDKSDLTGNSPKILTFQLPPLSEASMKLLLQPAPHGG